MHGELAFLDFPFDARLLACSQLPATEAPSAACPPAEVRSEESVQQTKGGPAETLERPEAIAKPIPSPDRSHAGRRNGVRGWIWALCAVLAVSAGLAASWRFFPDELSHLLQLVGSGEAKSSLGLRAELQNSDIRLTWDRHAESVLTAESGVLSIQDGSFTRQIQLDSAQVRAANILYSPTSDQVQMRLAVFGSRNATELVMAIIPRNASLRPGAPNPNSPPAAANEPVQPGSGGAAEPAGVANRWSRVPKAP
jgi:hypothetical protein